MMWLLANRWALYAAGVLGLLVAGSTALGVHDHRIRAEVKAACEAQMEKASQAAAIAYEADKEAERVRIAAIVEKYEKRVPDPVTVGLGQRVYKYALRSCPAAQAPDPASPGSPAEVPGSDTGAAIQDLIDAAESDAAQVRALQEAWPK